MTYIEKLAEKIGVKEATRAAFAGCPGDHFKDCENVRPGGSGLHRNGLRTVLAPRDERR